MKNGLFSEFKTFITRGNVLDMAIGVIIGGAFTTIVTSLVKDIIMPIVGIAFNGVSFTELKYVITPAVGDVAESAIYYGTFIQNIITFLLTAVVVFAIVKSINKVHKKKEAPKAAPVIPEDVKLLTEIRDLLQSK